MMINAQAAAYRVAGFLSLGDRLHFECPQSYADWFGCSWTRRELREDLHFGKLPEGLILMTPEGLRVVLGRQGAYDQMLGIMTHGEACLAREEAKQPAKGKRGRPDASEIVGMLREYRQWKGMSVREMAKMLGLSAELCGLVWVQLDAAGAAGGPAFWQAAGGVDPDDACGLAGGFGAAGGVCPDAGIYDPWGGLPGGGGAEETRSGKARPTGRGGDRWDAAGVSPEEGDEREGDGAYARDLRSRALSAG